MADKFVAILPALPLALGPFATREEAVAEIASRFPGAQHQTAILMPPVTVTVEAPEVVAPSSSPLIGRFLDRNPGDRIEEEEFAELRKAYIEALNRLKATDAAKLRKLVGPGTHHNLVTGAYASCQARIARKVYTALDEFLGAGTNAAVPAAPPAVAPEIEVANLPEAPKAEEAAPVEFLGHDLPGAILDVAVAKGMSRNPTEIAAAIGIKAAAVRAALAGKEPDPEDRAAIVAWLTA